jgi:hypothetical protein
MAKKKRKKKLAAVVVDQPQAPVVTVTCPNCGASVPADPGERTECTYCGTDLHLPRLEYEAEKEGEPPPSEEPGPPRRKLTPLAPRATPASASANAMVGVLIFGVFAIGMTFWVITRRASIDTSSSGGPAIAPRDPEVDGTLENARCLTDCIGPCQEIQNPDAMIACHEKCQAKCKFVGKGTASECHARCGKKCDNAVDIASKGACLGGCNAECPP